ncbi:MAG: hypothetical protein IPN71_06640 [Fibrobacteres bacterium]|nr:hypothetical protein [Fibrobacterota bacterium]
MRSLLHWFVGIAIAMAMVSCGGTNDEAYTTGTNDETYTSGVFFLSGGNARAAGARVQVFPRQQTDTVATGTTDQTGRPVIGPIADGSYSVKITSSGQVVILDSVQAISGRLQFLANDTLELPGTLAGVVKVQPQHDPATVTVHVLGTDIWTNVDSIGGFRLVGLASGNFRLQFTTALPDYQTTYPDPVRAWNDSDVVVAKPFNMVYTGIPVVLGLSVESDSSTGDLLLSWESRATYRSFQRYLIFRDTAGALNLSASVYGSTADSAWRDTGASRPLSSAAWSYRVVVQTMAGKVGEWYGSKQGTAVPPELRFVNKGTWTAIGRWRGGALGELAGKLAEVSSRTENGVLIVGVRSSEDGRLWDSGGVSLPLRKLGQAITWVSGLGAGKVWCLGHTSVGDGIDVRSSADGKTWTQDALPDSLWPLSTSNPIILGSASRLALYVPGKPGLVRENGSWRKAALPVSPIGADDSVVYSTGGGSHLLAIPWEDPSRIASDHGSLPFPLVAVAASTLHGKPVVLSAGRLWVQDSTGWTVRGSSGKAAITVAAGRLMVADSTGSLWIHEDSP